MAIAAAEGKPSAMEDLAIAETCQIHFQSTATQIEFYLLRDGESTAAAKSPHVRVSRQEIELAVSSVPAGQTALRDPRLR